MKTYLHSARNIGFIFLLSINIWACIDPIDPFSAGVMFNNNESFFINRFDSLGNDGVNFFKDCMIIKPGPNVKDITILTPTMDALPFNDLVTINNISISNNLIQLDVSYGGGCAAHEFFLCAESVLTATDPKTVNLRIYHDAHGDECKALITETLVFNLRPLENLFYNEAPLYINLNGYQLLWYPDITCSVKYRSHFFSSAMVHLVFTTVSSSVPQMYLRMRIITDPNIKFVSPFEYGKAVATELRWLSENKIITGVPEEKINDIEISLKNLQGQYWTRQDTVLPYNGKFKVERDSSGQIKWNNEVVMYRNGCGSSVEFTLPPSQLSGSGSSTSIFSGRERKSSFSLKVKLAGSSLIISGFKPVASRAYISIFDLKGRLIQRINISANQQSMSIDKIGMASKGVYQLVYEGENWKESRRFIFSR